MNKILNKFSPAVRARTVRLVQEQRASTPRYGSLLNRLPKIARMPLTPTAESSAMQNSSRTSMGSDPPTCGSVQTVLALDAREQAVVDRPSERNASLI